MHRTRMVLAGLILVGLAAAGAVETAGAATATAADTSQPGTVAFYQNPDFTGPNVTIRYPNCPIPDQQLSGPRRVSAFDNQPLPGCQVALVNRAGATTVLCAGRDLVPPEFRQDPRVRVRPGTSQPCGIGTAGSAG